MNRKRPASVVFFGSLAGLGLIVLGLLFWGAFVEAAWVGNFPLIATVMFGASGLVFNRSTSS